MGTPDPKGFADLRGRVMMSSEGGGTGVSF